MENPRTIPESPLFTVRNTLRHTLINGLDSICKSDMAIFNQSFVVLLHLELDEVPKHYTIMIYHLDQTYEQLELIKIHQELQQSFILQLGHHVFAIVSALHSFESKVGAPIWPTPSWDPSRLVKTKFFNDGSFWEWQIQWSNCLIGPQAAYICVQYDLG